MSSRAVVLRVVRGYRRGIASVLVGLLLGVIALPAVTTAQAVPIGDTGISLDRPTDGVGDSPLVP